MALIESGCNYTTLSATSLKLTANADESFMVRDIHVKGVSAGYATIKIGGTTVGYFRVASDVLGNQLPYIKTDSKMKTILGFLADAGEFKGYPVKTGSEFLVDVGSATQITIIYDRYDPGDILDTLENGKRSKSKLFIMYGRPAANINTATTTAIDTRVNPKDFSDFPFSSQNRGSDVFEIIGLCASERGADDGSTAANYVHTKYLLMKVDATPVSNYKDGNGFPMQGVTVGAGGTFEAENGYGLAGEGSDLYQRDPMLFKDKIICKDGADLDFYWTTEVHTTAGTLLTTEAEIGVIMRQIEAGGI